MRSKNNLDEINVLFGFLDKIKKQPPVVVNSLFDQLTFMTNDILVKLDRASMAHSIESRVPLLDYKVSLLTYSSNTDQHHDHKNKEKKIVLKKILIDISKNSYIVRKKKGFSLSKLEILKHKAIMEKMMYYSSNDFISKQGLFKHSQISSLVKKFYTSGRPKNSKFLWNFFIFQSWYDEYINPTANVSLQ